jgi:hypothetical protein
MIKTILIIPSKSIYLRPNKLNLYLRNLLNILIKKYLPFYYQKLITPKLNRNKIILDYFGIKTNNIPLPGNDISWWGALSSLKEYDAYIMGVPNNIFFNNQLTGDTYERWPVFFGFSPFKIINKKDLSIKNKFDYIFVSKKYSKKYSEIIKNIKKYGNKIIYIDAFDEESIYLEKKLKIIKPPEGYDYMFKQDISLNSITLRSYPLSPLPNNYEYKKIVKKQAKNIDIFFTGAYREGIVRPERLVVSQELLKLFPNSIIRLNQKKLSENDFQDFAYRALFHLSPGGRVWNSFRHTVAAKFGSIVILPSPNCRVSEPFFKDMHNCVMYDSEKILNEKFRESEIQNLRGKLISLINDEDFFNEILSNSLISINLHNRVNAAKYMMKIVSNDN